MELRYKRTINTIPDLDFGLFHWTGSASSIHPRDFGSFHTGIVIALSGKYCLTGLKIEIQFRF